MATAARHFRLDAAGGGDGEWTPTRIATRVSPPKEPMEERMLIPKTRSGGGKAVPSTTILDHASVAAKRGTIRLVSSSSVEGRRLSPSGDIGDGVREPEIVDLAAPTPLRSWTRRPPARHAPPPPPPPPPKRMPSWRKRGVPDTADKQSETSFGILDYYIHGNGSGTKSPGFQSKPGVASIRAVDPAIDRFDFGLEEARRARTPPPRRHETEVRPGAEQEEDEEMQLVPLSPRPFNEAEERSVVISHLNQPVEIQHRTTYSLFPAVKETKPSTVNRLVQVYNTPTGFETQATRVKITPHHYPPPKLLPGAEINTTNPNSKTPSTNRHRSSTTTTFSPPTTTTTIPSASPPTTLPSPTYNPKPPGATTRLIPLRILSTSSTSTTHTSLTHSTTSRSSTSTSNSPSSTSTQKPLLSNTSHRGSHSRWSEDTTLASPTTAAAVLSGVGRSSWGSLLGGSSPGLGGVGGVFYPDCFFEDDEEGWVREGRRGRGGRKARGWRGWVCCGRA